MLAVKRRTPDEGQQTNGESKESVMEVVDKPPVDSSQHKDGEEEGRGVEGAHKQDAQDEAQQKERDESESVEVRSDSSQKHDGAPSKSREIEVSPAESAETGEGDTQVARRTVIMIAHRLSTVANVNKVVVLKRGQIVEAGPPAELEAKRALDSFRWVIILLACLSVSLTPVQRMVTSRGCWTCRTSLLDTRVPPVLPSVVV